MLEIACPLLSEAAGSNVRGLVGSHDPVAAVEDALNMHGFDEAIVSTLPAHLSRWLRLDLPSKVEGMGVPVTRVVGTGLGASRERSVGAGSPGSGLLVRSPAPSTAGRARGRARASRCGCRRSSCGTGS